MWRRRPVTVPPPSVPEPALPAGLISITVPPLSPWEPAPPAGLVSITVPSNQTQPGSELANRSKRELIRKVMGQAKDKDSKVFIERIPRDIVITFVDRLEKTHQHFDTREYLLANCDFIKYDSDANSIVQRLAGGQEGKHRFFGYYKEVIRRSVQEHISLLNFEKRLNGGNLHNNFSEKEKPFESLCPVSELVLRTRQKDFVMDLNPEVELEKIKTSEPHFYHVEFVARQPPRDYISVKSKTVRLADVPRDTSEQEVMNLLSDCGDIECVQMIRNIEFPDEPQHAVVTFKELEGRDNALAKDLKIDNKPIRIISRNQMQVVYLSQPVDVRVGRGAEPATEKTEGDLNNMLHVLNNYWFCCQRYRMSNLLAAESAVDDTSPANNSVGVY